MFDLQNYERENDIQLTKDLNEYQCQVQELCLVAEELLNTLITTGDRNYSKTIASTMDNPSKGGFNSDEHDSADKGETTCMPIEIENRSASIEHSDELKQVESMVTQAPEVRCKRKRRRAGAARRMVRVRADAGPKPPPRNCTRAVRRRG